MPSDDKSSHVRDHQMHNLEILATLGTYDNVKTKEKRAHHRIIKGLPTTTMQKPGGLNPGARRGKQFLLPIGHQPRY